MPADETGDRAPGRDEPVLHYRRSSSAPVRSLDVISGAVAIIAGLLLAGLALLSTVVAIYLMSAIPVPNAVLSLVGTLLAIRVAWERLGRQEELDDIERD